MDLFSYLFHLFLIHSKRSIQYTTITREMVNTNTNTKNDTICNDEIFNNTRPKPYLYNKRYPEPLPFDI